MWAERGLSGGGLAGSACCQDVHDLVDGLN